jgi:glutamyl-tRNA synthetase
MVNFLALLGWSPGTDQEVFTRDELIDQFTLEGISGGNAVFNPEKLDWMNQQHLMRLAAEEIVRRAEPLLRAAGLWRDSFAGADREWLLRVIDLLKRRARKLSQIVEDARPFLDDQIVPEAEAAKRHLSSAALRQPFTTLIEAFAAIDRFEPAGLETVLRRTAEQAGIKAGALIHATRVAAIGRAVSPGLFEVLELLGQDRTVARMRAAERLIPS